MDSRQLTGFWSRAYVCIFMCVCTGGSQVQRAGSHPHHRDRWIESQGVLETVCYNSDPQRAYLYTEPILTPNTQAHAHTHIRHSRRLMEAAVVLLDKSITQFVTIADALRVSPVCWNALLRVTAVDETNRWSLSPHSMGKVTTNRKGYREENERTPFSPNLPPKPPFLQNIFNKTNINKIPHL